jgi:hypothetical protein
MNYESIAAATLRPLPQIVHAPAIHSAMSAAIFDLFLRGRNTFQFLYEKVRKR